MAGSARLHARHRQQAARPRQVRRLLTRAVAVGAVAALYTAATGTGAQAIVRGTDSSEPYPFMVAIPMTPGDGEGSLDAMCGGALIAPQWVVTAGHCAQEVMPAHPSGTVRVGSDHRKAGGSVRKIVAKVVHPGFDTSGDKRSNDDIALLKLDRPVRQQPVRIAGRAPAVGADTRVIGFGTVVDDPEPGRWVFPDRLQELNTRRTATADCMDINGKGELCTSSRVRGAMACSGDSGGPQVQRVGGRWDLVGVTSGDGDYAVDPHCGSGPGIWTSVSAYKDWITRTIAAHH
ncbi:S1 family peptidase [Streptomyces sp. NPDC059985]|uniref:S1 family peptidase n=1 Tax=Streptomyces sp. NPDC059985 TaxID=3347025 RepID=UPI0036B37C6E